ncbi:Cu(I)-responsive transcriptional regulator [Photobacterium minamisatsumaniensis]|uniref:Cu(I)-responsive transcriptional regulator n=1 Tax=Photobacterium minamisatsumaniensis TaxID=2910233 RepID=UPI003D113414
MFNISQVSKQTGLSSKTIRYYESIGLISTPPRAENGYRFFNQKIMDELKFVVKAKQAGFNLDESKQLLDLQRAEDRISGDVKALTLHKISEVEERIAQLNSMLTLLKGLADKCPGGESPDCSIIDSLADKCVRE